MSFLSFLFVLFKQIVPELRCSFPSRLTFSWVTPLILRGFRNPLTEDDCWQLEISERAINVVARVQACFQGYEDYFIINFVSNYLIFKDHLNKRNQLPIKSVDHSINMQKLQQRN